LSSLCQYPKSAKCDDIARSPTNSHDTASSQSLLKLSENRKQSGADSTCGYSRIQWSRVGAEAAIAGKFVEAADIYAGHPAALQLRAMNIIYETTKERGATILIPSAMVDSLNPSTTLSLAFARTAVPDPAIPREPKVAV
jgi:hypothetical protein